MIWNATLRRVFLGATLFATLGAGAIAIADTPAAPPEVAARKMMPPPAAAQDPKIAFEKFTLPNGLEVILAPDKSVPLVAVDVWYHVGSGNETVGKSGFAHLFEHMLFQGSKNVGADRHFDILKKIGVSEVNGTTNTDRTNYYEVVPSNQLETALWLESDRMSHLLEMLTKPSLDNQIDVVRNERRQRYDNVPYGKARLELAAMLYPEGHPYRYTTIGRHEDLTSASVDDVKNFFKTWYVPANATLAIVGDFDADAVKATVTKWFGSFPPSQKPTTIVVPAPAISATRAAADKTITDDFAKLRQLQFAWQSPANFAPGDAELDIAANALTDEGTGRLYKILVHEKQLAQGVAAYQGGQGFSGTFNLVVTLRSDADEAQVRQIVFDELARMATTGPTDREVARAVTSFEASSVYGLESLFARAEQLQSFNHYLGDPDRLTWNLDRYRHSSPDAVRAAVAQYLGRDHAVTLTIDPGTPAAAAGAK